MLHDEGIPIGRNKLFEWLRDSKILTKDNTPYQAYIKSGYFKVKEAIRTIDGQTRVFPVSFTTGKGQLFIAKKIQSEFSRVV